MAAHIATISYGVGLLSVYPQLELEKVEVSKLRAVLASDASRLGISDIQRLMTLQPTTPGSSLPAPPSQHTAHHQSYHPPSGGMSQPPTLGYGGAYVRPGSQLQTSMLSATRYPPSGGSSSLGSSQISSSLVHSQARVSGVNVGGGGGPQSGPYVSPHPTTSIGMSSQLQSHIQRQ